MFTYTVANADGFHGGTAESFQLVKRDGKITVVSTGLDWGKYETICETTGKWTFRAGGQIVLQVDLEDSDEAAE